ncbi:MAG: DNA adenine methylase [Pelotomaculum sp. PtaU1.Bin065]|nr:MAG: DNA adenine methylase [Pelotomaculum sp. PtaU1.Bin065]
MNAILKYPGSKWRIAQWIISKFPKHHSYLEPYAGSLSVLFNKTPSNIETVNDLDGDVVNFFQCIREDWVKLAKLVEATPYSRNEYDRVFEVAAPDCRYEKARLFLIKCWQGHGYRVNQYKVGWKNDVQGRERAYAMRHWGELPERILLAAERLKQVQIECMPAVELIKRFKFRRVLIYCDPPYLIETRKSHVKQQYSHEMLNEQEHVELLEVLLQHPGYVVISGCESSLYREMLEDRGWNKAIIQSNDQSNKPRSEVIWMNYQPQAEQLSFIV